MKLMAGCGDVAAVTNEETRSIAAYFRGAPGSSRKSKVVDSDDEGDEYDDDDDLKDFVVDEEDVDGGQEDHPGLRALRRHSKPTESNPGPRRDSRYAHGIQRFFPGARRDDGNDAISVDDFTAWLQFMAFGLLDPDFEEQLLDSDEHRLYFSEAQKRVEDKICQSFSSVVSSGAWSLNFMEQVRHGGRMCPIMFLYFQSCF